MFNLKFATGGSAFRDPYNGEEDDLFERLECVRILKKITQAVEDGATYGPIMDINGNKIGEWSNE